MVVEEDRVAREEEGKVSRRESVLPGKFTCRVECGTKEVSQSERKRKEKRGVKRNIYPLSLRHRTYFKHKASSSVPLLLYALCNV